MDIKKYSTSMTSNLHGRIKKLEITVLKQGHSIEDLNARINLLMDVNDELVEQITEIKLRGKNS